MVAGALRLRIMGVLGLVAGVIGIAALAERPAGAQESRPLSPETRASRPDPARFAEEVRAFREWDRRNAFPHGGVLFVGSSSIRGWATRESFPELPVINRGFGGSHVSDVVHYFEQVIQPYGARVIAVYVGDNDIAAGLTPEEVRDDYRALLGRIRAAQPAAAVVILSIKPSASRWQHWPAMQQANKLLAELAARERQVTFVDVGTPLLGTDGRPRAELFLKDVLHLNAAGYEVWTRTLRPVLERMLEEQAAKAGGGTG
jgi:lysophospholipase L1-like esterase